MEKEYSERERQTILSAYLVHRIELGLQDLCLCPKVHGPLAPKEGILQGKRCSHHMEDKFIQALLVIANRLSSILLSSCRGSQHGTAQLTNDSAWRACSLFACGLGKAPSLEVLCLLPLNDDIAEHGVGIKKTGQRAEN